eukprot:15444991-Alexandrium_andersonii.AAC.1
MSHLALYTCIDHASYNSQATRQCGFFTLNASSIAGARKHALRRPAAGLLPRTSSVSYTHLRAHETSAHR